MDVRLDALNVNKCDITSLFIGRSSLELALLMISFLRLITSTKDSWSAR